MSEQQDYFQISDNAWLECRAVKHAYLNSSAADFFSAASDSELMTELQRLDAESAGQLHAIAERDPELANYLRLQNHKIDVVAKTLINNVQADGQTTQEILISEIGIQFNSNERFNKGQWLALRIMLESGPLLFCCFAEVLASETTSATQSGRRISAEFAWQDEEERDTLARHILRQQAKQRRAQIA